LKVGATKMLNINQILGRRFKIFLMNKIAYIFDPIINKLKINDTFVINIFEFNYV
jgi:hypothetical protein